VEFSEVGKTLKCCIKDQLNMYFECDAAAKTANATFGHIKTFTSLLKSYINFGVHMLESNLKFVFFLIQKIEVRDFKFKSLKLFQKRSSIIIFHCHMGNNTDRATSHSSLNENLTSDSL